MKEEYRLPYGAEEIAERLGKVDDIPTKVSQLENDAEYLTKQDIPDLETIRAGAQKGATALQEHQDISHLATKQEVKDELKKKADTDGSYPLMSVGYSADLLGRGESVPAEFSFRASGGKSIKDGTAWIKRLKGNSVVWNQLWDSNNLFSRECSFTLNNGVYTITPQDEKLYLVLYCPINKPVGHHMLISYDIQVVSDKDFVQETYLGYFASPTQWFNGGYGLSINSLKTRTHREEILELDTDKNAVHIGCPYTKHTADGVYTVLDSSDRIYIYNPRVIDLTLMFGEGNEPTTIEEFYSRCPIGIDMNAYNEGEVIHMTAEGIKSVGDNAWDEEWEIGGINYNSGLDVAVTSKCRNRGFVKVLPNEEYYLSVPSISELSSVVVICYDENKQFVNHIGGGSANARFTIPSDCHYIRFTWVGTTYNNDIMITLVHSGWKQDTDAGYQPYWEDNLMFDQRIKDEFPDGMKKWDKVYNKDGKGYIVKGTGVADMGDMAWSLYGSGFSSESLEHLAKAPTTPGSPSPITCGKYSTKNAGHSTSWADTDKVCYMSYDGRGVVHVNDSAYTDAASFKAAIAGVPLYYELAEPTIIEYDEPFNLDYKVADFGTEQAIGNSPSAPISADIIYQFNAVDMIREHEIEINELKNLIAEMQTKLNSLS